MTAEEHIVAYIESDQPLYKQLLEIARRRQPGCADGFMRGSGVVCAALNLVTAAYSEMLANGSALRDDPYSAVELARTAAALCVWEAPE